MEYIHFFARTTYQSLVAPAGPFFTEKDYPDLTGQNWLVTGSTGGIGLEIAKILAKQNANLILVGRSQAKLDAAAATVKNEKPDTEVHFVVIDFNDLAQFKPAVNQLKKQVKSLNGIIHNAGVMNVPTGAKTKQGHEQTMGVNNLASQLLQDLLDPLIVNTPNARIVWLSSLIHLVAPAGGFSVKTIAGGNTSQIYAVSKSLNYMQAVQWSLRHPEATTVKSIAAHPGIIKSELVRSTSYFQKLVINAISYDTYYGALSPIFAALCPDAPNGGYIVPFGRPGEVRPDIKAAARDARGDAAMNWVEERIRQFK